MDQNTMEEVAPQPEADPSEVNSLNNNIDSYIDSTDDKQAMVNMDDTPPAKGSASSITEAFTLFPKLPPEIRQEIWRASMDLPGIEYFGIHPMILALPHMWTLIPRSPSRRGVRSTSARWVQVSKVNDESNAIVNLVAKQPDTKRAFEKRSLINQDLSLVVVHLPKGAAMGERTWVDAHVNADPDLVYEHIGRSLKRVGIWWQLDVQRCNDNGHGIGPATPWAPHGNMPGVRCFGPGPCFDLVVRYIPFFRDADVLYFMVYLDGKGIQNHVKKHVNRRNVLRHLSEIIVTSAKSEELGTWQDYYNTWYEMKHSLALTFLTESARAPWATVEFLDHHLKNILGPAERAKVNPNMKFKVLVTTHHMRR